MSLIRTLHSALIRSNLNRSVLSAVLPCWKCYHFRFGYSYYPPGCELPWATIIGSANLGERSVRRDLEAQAAIFTVSQDLKERLHDECTRLHQYATECSKNLEERQTPLWVRASVGLFKTYF